ncbi:MAG TPA: D-arabinose 5-phosphate isomerase [Deltaproteobacteria bacterium]|nr:MAG: D-arabinose 5-phosphate isomerase [Deltaproteobacteria bacterium GWA2_55_82]OGQ63773.1 MAG: D-arabinose 5-phosphate isomerase [Deltaproteobacteria bacterium RIFCSPLOWO2_02_FULL_55_12]OIJ73365.1 MAG: D-arabinose 5-phosphate isomerase [Deltaproteobacteria bacterium GWC2_55_46]HBG45359.1 D-arabinose 5-phosphate isomerase [Deltaproteobacteria bacterium]HCY10190.1 D-arabinose 5-phosphate isomerase [Deltaproteobacteria bacterium]
MITKDAIDTAKRVLTIEAEAIKALVEKLDGGFTRAVDIICAATGKVVVCGMGKSGIIGQKIASTLASTGTPAFFLHPAEGVHGDIGMLMKNDVLLAISNSGETEELIKIIPIVKRMGIKMIAMTGRKDSSLARYGDVLLDVGVAEEACPLGLAPTASTTATLAMGDALAVALIEKKGFMEADFAGLHPAGSLGRRLMKVSELMHSGDSIPGIGPDTLMRDAILVMTAKRMGLTGVFDKGALVGIITDGDLRRALEKGADIFGRRAAEVMTKNPLTISGEELAESALRMMEERSITSLFVTGEGMKAIGVVHMHDLLKAGVV